MIRANSDTADSQVVDLESEVKSYDRLLRRRPNEHNVHYAKAGVLVKLGEITGDKSFYERALESYNKAIELSTQNVLYLSDRSKLHIIMERPDLATQDIIEIRNSPRMANKVYDMYANKTVQDVLKLSNVQTEIHKLIVDGKLPGELEAVFADMVNVISGISLRVSSHDERLNAHDEKFEAQTAELERMKEQLTKFQSEYPELLKIVESMSKEIATLQGQVAGHDQSIQNIAQEITKVCSKEEFDVLAKRFDEIEAEILLFDGKVKVMQGTVDKHETLIFTIDNSLEQAGFFNKQKIREEFEELKSIGLNQAVYNYASSFYWSLSNYVIAYRSVASGAVKGVRDKSHLERIWDKVGPTFINVCKAIPIAGGFLGLIEDTLIILHNGYKDFKFEHKVAKINSFLTSYLLEEDLNLAIASASIKIAKLKKDEILNEPSPNSVAVGQNESKASKVKTKIEKNVEKFENKLQDLLIKISKVHKTIDNPESKMAMKDVVLLINYIATNEIVLVTKDTASSLDKVILDVFANNIGNTNQAIHQAISNSITSQAATNDSKCIIAKAEVIYDNRLLNHMELIKEAGNRFGISKVLELSSLLSSDLISEAIDNQDQDLILAGMISLS
ncbi:MAG: hypothetical protein K0Q51_1560 [Rickettsiaceae bacterium]|jgi:tetratricopeptide (TPR) repeat protein|nr:hypothetical protein [Rickettsiaceae bacterium]